ncbi:MAG: L-seryl-tRNA(Sec) selenium transferase [Acidobacteria bacterium]|nr:L-seryl-tRNA(Sec) selenium transferase [Acidobacteriota bacterium]
MSRARVIPAVDLLLGHPEVQALTARHGAGPVRDALDAAIQGLRTALLAGDARDIVDRTDAEAALLARIAIAFATRRRAALQPVINATGVIIHTNLGRAPLGSGALAAMREVAAGYCTLEFDLASGQRGSRHALLDRSLREATGADSGLVTNNTAAAMTVALAALAAGREVIISRGELVEIGGGFRVPDILRMSGAVLREVGTTNRTRVADYAAAVSPRTGAILRVHPSNFRMAGFTDRPGLGDLAAMARRLEVPLLEDQGSGWLGLDLFDADAFPAETRALLADEPAVRASVRQGADVVGFSGDKLLGGPQCGILVGRQDLLDRIRAHPLMRAVRADKLTYAALDATLQAFTQGRAMSDVPVVRMLAEPAEAIEARATRLHDRLRDDHADVRLEGGWSTIGGGSAPGSAVATTLVSVGTDAADRLLARMRDGTPPVIARIVDDRVCADLRTVDPASDQVLADALTMALALR